MGFVVQLLAFSLAVVREVCVGRWRDMLGSGISCGLQCRIVVWLSVGCELLLLGKWGGW